MPLPTRRLLLFCLVLPMLGACASGKPVEWRLQVRTTDEWADLQQLAERVAQIGGVPVKPEVDPIAPRWYALTLQCEDRGACKRATMRLAAQPALFVELRPDRTRQGPARPPENLAQ